MAGTEPVTFGPADAADCLALSVEAGWNQSVADWRMMLQAGYAPGLRAADGCPVASALALPMDGGIGWISMVLVTKTLRRQGIAQRLVGDCIAWLEKRGLCPVLDATPAGQPLYSKMGFARLCDLTRLSGQGGGAAPGDTDIRTATLEDTDWILALDETVLGAARGPIIRDMLARPQGVASVWKNAGFVLSRTGQTATQVGPLVAPDADTALTLLKSALAQIEGPVLIDAMDAQPAIADWLKQRGFTEERPFQRMGRGLNHMPGDPLRSFAAAGPELG